MYVCERRPVYIPRYTSRAARLHTCVHTRVCMRCVCVRRGVRRRWAILISLRGLSSTSTFPHSRSRLCGTFPANRPTHHRHPPPTHPRERTLRVVTFGGHFKPPTPPVSTRPFARPPLLSHLSEPRSLRAHLGCSSQSLVLPSK